LVASTCPDSRLFVKMDWICKHWPTYHYLTLSDAFHVRRTLISAANEAVC
jgi:hypothetical protein